MVETGERCAQMSEGIKAHESKLGDVHELELAIKTQTESLETMEQNVAAANSEVSTFKAKREADAQIMRAAQQSIEYVRGTFEQTISEVKEAAKEAISRCDEQADSLQDLKADVDKVVDEGAEDAELCCERLRWIRWIF